MMLLGVVAIGEMFFGSLFPFLLTEPIASNIAGAVASPLLWGATTLWLAVTFLVSAGTYHSFENPVSRPS